MTQTTQDSPLFSRRPLTRQRWSNPHLRPRSQRGRRLARHRIAILAGIAACFASRLATQATHADEPPIVSKTRFQAIVEYLSSDDMKGRAGVDAIRAGGWVAEQFQSLGLDPLFDDAYIQPIPDRDGAPWGTNVGAMLRGSDPARENDVVIVSGHHDHLGTIDGQIFNGANDNATAVAMVLEAARVLKDRRPARTVVFLSFDLEENMLWGSRYFVANPPATLKLDDISLFITADMIGRPLGGMSFNEVFVMGSETAEPLRSIVARASHDASQPVLSLGADIVGTRSDYGPFRDKEIPFLFFSTGENPDYHTPNDTADRIDFDLATRIATVMTDVTTAAANSDATFRWTGKPPTGIDEAIALNRVCEVVNSEVEKGNLKLGLVEKVLVTQTAEKTATIIKNGKMSPGERTWLVRAAQGMLLALF